jgi:hypothetical protein
MSGIAIARFSKLSAAQCFIIRQLLLKKLG